MTDKRTAWYPITTNPVRIGWYEYRMGAATIHMARWNGQHWDWNGVSGKMVKMFEFPTDQWRGLAKEPK